MKKFTNLFSKYSHFIYRGITKSNPVQLTLFVTSRCNIRCKMCFYWEPVENKSTEELTLSEIEKISKSMPNFFWLLLGGGEVFVRKDIAEIVEIFYKNNNLKHLSIPTNATYEGQVVETLEKILINCPHLFVNINLSLNGLADQHDKLCQSDGVFDKFLLTYKSLSILKKKYKNLGIGLNVTHSLFNEHDLNNIIDYTVSSLPNVDNISLGLVRGRPKDSSALTVNMEKYKEAVVKIENYVVSKKLKTFNTFLGRVAFIKDMIMRRVIANTVKFGYQIPCLAGKTSLVIDEKANVYPCEMLSSIGNLRENNYNFQTILKSEKLKKAVDNIKCSNCYCTHECSYSTNILFNIPMIFVILRIYILFVLKSFFGFKNIYKKFDDLKYSSNLTTKKSYFGQKGDLYSGRTFGILDDAEKKKKPTIPF